jgi:hypothetical protein
LYQDQHLTTLKSKAGVELGVTDLLPRETIPGVLNTLQPIITLYEQVERVLRMTRSLFDRTVLPPVIGEGCVRIEATNVDLDAGSCLAARLTCDYAAITSPIKA